MNLLYATSIAFSDKLAHRVQIRVMAAEFQKKLGENFYLGVNYINKDDKSIKIICFNSGKSYVLAWRYLKFIKEKKIYYVYCREARLLFFLILYNKLFYYQKLKFIYEIHSLLERDLTDKIIDKILSIFVNKFIFVTKNLYKIYLKKYSVNQEKVIIAPDSVDLAIFDIDLSMEEAREKLNLPENKKIIGFCGKFKTMGMDKGINGILQALSMLDKEIFFIAIGGSKENIDYYQKQAAKLQVLNKVMLIGYVDQKILAIYQKAFDVLLMPFPYNQHYAYYMSPLKMFEYMASKRPIIATDLPSIREVLNKDNAVLVKPDNLKDLVYGIKKVLDNNGLVKGIAKQAFSDVQDYTWEKRVEKIIGFIKKI